jgi:hypothetical protein
MTSKLLKQLKDAGFPELDPHQLWVRDRSNGFTIPSLSELVEACDLPFYLHCNVKGYWYAYNSKHSESVKGEGSTPEEAVANLWLALHETN